VLVSSPDKFKVTVFRLRDAARMFHSRNMPEVHWSGIRARRLSSNHGEFCKLFCSRTSREVDFFSDSGAQSGEQLLNMISMCTAFSSEGNQYLPIDVKNASLSMPFRCTVHSSLFAPFVLSVVASSKNPSDRSAPNPVNTHQVKLWIGSMNEAGDWVCDERKLQADTLVSFSDAGYGLPLNISAVCHYQPTCIETGSVRLLRPNFCSLFDVGHSSLNDLKLALDKTKKGAAGQPISRDLKVLVDADPSNHAALKLALEGVQKGVVDCEIAKYLRTIFSVDHENHAAVKSALEDLKKVLVGQQDLREPGVIDFRNKLAHDLLTLEARHFNALLACARTMFAGVCSVIPFVSQNARDVQEDLSCAEESLADIEQIIERDSNFQGLKSSLTVQEQGVVAREYELMREAHEQLKKKLDRKFDSFIVCLKKDIQDQLVDSNQIGESGGQGKVYRVKHWLWGQTLAVKVFHDTIEGHAWRRELNSLTFLTHANIVRMLYIVYEAVDDRSQGRPPVGYVIELMACSAASRRRQQNLGLLLDMFVQIARALAFSHENGVVHFDVKPENILLDESFSIAKLCDFGCAHKLKSASACESVMGQKLGSDRCMAPEVLLGKFDYDPKLCDIYSFGKTMWKLLHPAQDVEINVASPVNADVPPALKELIEQCLIKDPAERPHNMTDVLERLQSIPESYRNLSTYEAEYQDLSTYEAEYPDFSTYEAESPQVDENHEQEVDGCRAQISSLLLVSSSNLLTWACASPLPKEDIFICFNDQDAIDQGWPPALMTSVASQQLHQIGLTKTSALIRAALELGPASFSSILGSGFVERTHDVQAALKCLCGALGQSTTKQQQNNLRDYQTRIQIELEKQISVFGDPISPSLAPDSSTFDHTYDQSEKLFFDACYEGDVVLANKLLGESFIDLNAKDMNYRNQTFLYTACRGPNCQPAIVELLLRHRASTKVPSGQTQSLPLHALVINFVDCTHQANPSFIPKTKFDEYFARLAAIIQLLKKYHADFNSMNVHGHSAYSELKHEPAEIFVPARSHDKYKDFEKMIQDSSARKLHVEALLPDQVAGVMHDAELQAACEFLCKN
jgi:serine/threonine protein kinase